MSQLNLNIPVTFDAEAALTISDNIKQRVQNAEAHMTSFEQDAEGFKLFTSYLGEQKSGLVITENDITLSANTTYIKSPGSNVETLFTSNGKIKTNYINADSITATSLHTTGGNSYVDIGAGLITCTGASTNTKIEFGIDAEGNAVLKFIKDDTEIYNLGPNGLISLNFSTKENRFENVSIDNMSSNTILSVYNTTSSNTSIYLPFYRVTSSESATLGNIVTYNVNFNYYRNFGDGSEQNEENVVFYEPISQLFPGSKLLILDLTQLSAYDTYYVFYCGERKIESIINYSDGDGNWSTNKPSYNGKTYKSNSTISNNYLTNTSNYVNNGYYINGDVSINIDPDFVPAFLTLSNETYPAYTITAYNNNNTYVFIDHDNILNVKQFTIYLYNNGLSSQSYTIYCLCGYISNTLINHTWYGSYLSNHIYYTNINGAQGYGTQYIGEPTYGILCSSSGIVYDPYSSDNIGSNITEYLDNYITWLDTNNNPSHEAYEDAEDEA